MNKPKIYPLQIVSIIVAIRCQGKYLLVQRDSKDDIFPSKWQNPGGKIELGETIEEAIKREIKEEVGISINCHPIFLQSYAWKKDSDPVRLGIIFLIDLKGKISAHKIKLALELVAYKWLTIQKIKKLNSLNKLIGKESPTGTLGQLLKAESIK